MNTTGDTTVQDDSDEQQEVIEVQILPQVSSIYLSKNFWRDFILHKCRWIELSFLENFSLRSLSIVNSQKYAQAVSGHIY